MARGAAQKHRITDLTVHEVSLVDHPANERAFLLLKSLTKGRISKMDSEIIEAQGVLLTRKVTAAISKAAASPETSAQEAANLRALAKELELLADAIDPAVEDADAAEDDETETETAATSETAAAASAGAAPAPAGALSDIDKLVEALVPALAKRMNIPLPGAATPAAKATTPPAAKPRVPGTAVAKGRPVSSNVQPSDPTGTSAAKAWPADLNDDPNDDET
jgi:hypothetical protein